MCDFNGRLIAWLDHELPKDEAGDVGRHVQACGECQKRVDAYERASTAFNAYCDALNAAELRRRVPRWKVGGLGIGAAAAVMVLALLAQHRNTEVPQLQVSAPTAKARPTVLADATGARASLSETVPIKAISLRKVRRRNVVAPVQKQDPNLLPAGPAIQITIPAEAVLPPGAIPPGANFVVDLSIAPDGSAQGLRLRPQLAGFERRATQP